MTIYLEDKPTCQHRDYLEGDDHFPRGPVCGKPAMFFDCGTTDMTVCDEHKCRCKLRIRRRPLLDPIIATAVHEELCVVPCVAQRFKQDRSGCNVALQAKSMFPNTSLNELTIRSGMGAAPDPPGRIRFLVGDHEAMRIEPDGIFLVNGEKVGSSKEVYEAFCAWVRSAETIWK